MGDPKDPRKPRSGSGTPTSSPGYNPSTFLSRGGIGQNEMDLLHAAVYADLKGAGGKGTLPTESLARRTSTSGGNDNDLMASMAKRLAQCEAHSRALKEELVKKDHALREANKKADQNAAQNEELEVIKIQNSKLALQVVEMTHFLKEQGYDWVGSGRVSPLVRGSTEPSSSTSSPKRGSIVSSAEAFAETVPIGGGARFSLDSIPGTSQNFSWKESHEATEPSSNQMYFTMSLLIVKVNELNLYAGEKIIAAEKLADGREMTKFCDPDAIEVIVYNDGICVERGVFRPYDWPLCRAFLDDILEGYYPYEYQEKFPKGMVINLIDHSTEPHPTAEKPTNIQSVSDAGYRVLNKDAFIKRIPKQMITSTGKMVNVRDDLSAYLNGKEGGDEEVTEPIEIGGEGANVLMQVRVVDRGIVVARLHESSTIGDVRGFVATQLPEQHIGKAFELITAYPRVIYTDDTQTLEAAKLIPNAALLMRLV